MGLAIDYQFTFMFAICFNYPFADLRFVSIIPLQITITAAFGFDSFLVMRHGPRPSSFARDLRAEAANNLSSGLDNLALTDRGVKRLGCYFCNDVVAPTDVIYYNAMEGLYI